jgi:hypothetical protein
VTETEELTFEDVLRAGRVLFGPAFAAESGAWQDTLKATYRQRAMQTHPDRARALGRAEADLLREFRRVAEAYRLLASLRNRALPPGGGRARAPAPPSRRPAPSPRRDSAPARSAPRPSAAPAGPPPRASGAPRVRASVRPEDLPRRRLRFAEYLYYSGRVRWTELVEAVAWQRAQRPPVGRIAVDFGFLAPGDVGVVLERRREAGASGVAFGEWAVRLGYLTPFQLLAVLGQQLRRQRPIGQFFVERGLILPSDVEVVRRAVLRHNARHLG